MINLQENSFLHSNVFGHKAFISVLF